MSDALRRVINKVLTANGKPSLKDLLPVHSHIATLCTQSKESELCVREIEVLKESIESIVETYLARITSNNDTCKDARDELERIICSIHDFLVDYYSGMALYDNEGRVACRVLRVFEWNNVLLKPSDLIYMRPGEALLAKLLGYVETLKSPFKDYVKK